MSTAGEESPNPADGTPDPIDPDPPVAPGICPPPKEPGVVKLGASAYMDDPLMPMPPPPPPMPTMPLVEPRSNYSLDVECPKTSGDEREAEGAGECRVGAVFEIVSVA